MELDEIILKLKLLKGEAECMDFKMKQEANYEWEIGAGIKLKLAFSINLPVEEFKKMTIFGFPVRVNYENKEIIKLWREVKYDLSIL